MSSRVLTPCKGEAVILSADVTSGSPNELELGQIPETAFIDSIIVEVAETFDGSPTLTVGDNSDNDKFMRNLEVDLSRGFKYLSIVGISLSSATTGKIFFSDGGASKGTCTVTLIYLT